jgi:hypothetical protein
MEGEVRFIITVNFLRGLGWGLALWFRSCATYVAILIRQCTSIAMNFHCLINLIIAVSQYKGVVSTGHIFLVFIIAPLFDTILIRFSVHGIREKRKWIYLPFDPTKSWEVYTAECGSSLVFQLIVCLFVCLLLLLGFYACHSLMDTIMLSDTQVCFRVPSVCSSC